MGWVPARQRLLQNRKEPLKIACQEQRVDAVIDDTADPTESSFEKSPKWTERCGDPRHRAAVFGKHCS